MTELRDYQLLAKDAVREAYTQGRHRVGLSLPCRTGKSLIMASLAADLHGRGRVSVTLVHRDVLVDQTVKTFQKLLPKSAIGVVKAARNEVDRPVIIASVQTLARGDRLAQLPVPALVMVDEAHVSAAPSYRRVLEYFGTVPGGPGYLLGVSATWERSDGRGLGGVYEEVVFRRSFRWALGKGLIVPPRTLKLGAPVDLSGARRTAGGEYRDTDMAELVMIESLADTVVAGYREHGHGKPAALFAPTKASARYFGAAFAAAGVKTAEIFDDTSKSQRDFALASHANGAVKVLLTCTALGIGWDSPQCCVGMLVRPFNHLTPFIQTVSRVLTPWPGKSEGLILDFVGATDGKSMRSVIDLSLPVNRVIDPFEDAEDDDFHSVSEPGPRLVKRIEGTHQVDLFAGTGARWLRTEHGVPFVATREHLYFLAQADGAWSVGRCAARSTRGGRWLIQGLPAADALEYGSELALEEDSSIAGTTASWRSGSRAPSASQVETARSLGIEVSGANRADLSDAISIQIATQVLSAIKGA